METKSDNLIRMTLPDGYARPGSPDNSTREAPQIAPVSRERMSPSDRPCRSLGAPPESDPPFLIGGLSRLISQTGTEQVAQNPNITLSGVGYDALTLTVPTETAEVLLHHTEPVQEDPVSVRGFRTAQKHLCMGGECWRRWEPTSSSPVYGTEYESWEFKGTPTFDAVSRMIHHRGRPSRIDIAFDYCVPEDMYPRDCEKLITEHADLAGYGISYSGPRDTHTVYVGSRQSERMLRIYRRDIKNPLLAHEGIHLLRFELELKKKMAHAFWAHMREVGIDEAHKAAAAHVATMIGYSPLPEISEVPPLVRTQEDTEAVQMLLQFVKQNAIMLQACDIAGIDVADLAKCKNESSNHPRKIKERLSAKLQLLGNYDSDRIVQTVKALM